MQVMGTKNIEDIILAKVSGEILSGSESAIFEEWYDEAGNREHYNSLLGIRSALLESSISQKVDAGKAWSKVRPAAKKRMTAWRAMKYAAILLLPLMCGAAVYLMTQKGPDLLAEIEPGQKKAILVMPDGRELDLTSVTEILGTEGVTARNDLAEGLTYDVAESGSVMHKIVIPRGGEYNLRLSDGTVVWLNSESSLSYPTSFDSNKREVEIEGEAYFEVAQDAAKPFIVKTRDYDIRVTGTEFNVRSYSNTGTATTLVEGSVTIESDGTHYRLAPGQLAVAKDGSVSVGDANMEMETAWKDGAFAFSSTRLDEIMEQLMRWYDIKVIFDAPETKQYRFFAWFERESKFEDILSVLEQTNKVAFDLKGNTLRIDKK